MKKYIYRASRIFVGALVCLSTMAVTTSCDQLEDEFDNPDEMTEARLDLFFAEALKKEHLFRLGYGPSYHHLNTFARELGLGANPSMSFKSRVGTTGKEFWNDWSGAVFYPHIFEKTGADYTLNLNGMRLLYNDMSPAEQENYDIFMICSRIVKAYAFQRATDLYDDMPYSEAGGAFSEQFFPKFDTQEEIYTAILADLEAASSELEEIIKAGSAGIPPVGRSQFNVSDILNGGDVEKWLRLSNSLRLRMGLRLVNVKPDESKALVTKLIKEDRLITEPKYDVTFRERDQNPTVVSQDLFFRGFEEMGHVLVAPQFILEEIFHANLADIDQNKVDPRLYVIFQPNKDGEYVGLSSLPDDFDYYRQFWKSDKFTEQQFKARLDSIENSYDFKAVEPKENDGSGSSWHTGRLVAKYNRATYLNYKMEFPVFQSNEVNLIIAEAAVRWPGAVSADAAQKVADAIDASTRFYYDLNVNNTYNQSSSPQALYIPKGAQLAKLDEAYLAAYLTNAKAEFNGLNTTDKFKFIYRQKYVHNNILYPYESFSDARRIIKDLDDNELPITIMCNYYWWERLRYPDTEAKNNPDNFAKVAAKNKMTLPVWWSGRTKAATNPNYHGSPLITTE